MHLKTESIYVRPTVVKVVGLILCDFSRNRSVSDPLTCHHLQLILLVIQVDSSLCSLIGKEKNLKIVLLAL